MLLFDSIVEVKAIRFFLGFCAGLYCCAGVAAPTSSTDSTSVIVNTTTTPVKRSYVLYQSPG